VLKYNLIPRLPVNQLKPVDGDCNFLANLSLFTMTAGVRTVANLIVHFAVAW